MSPFFFGSVGYVGIRSVLAGGQIDPGWWLIRLLLTTKQAEVRHEELKLKQAV